MQFKKRCRQFVLPLLLGLLVLAPGKSQAQRETISGNGTIKKEKRDISGSFRQIATSGSFKIYIKQGGTHSVEVEADENLLPYIETEVKNNALSIHPKKDYNIKPSAKATIYIALPQLEAVAASGSSAIYSQGSLSGDKLEVGLSGQTAVELVVQYSKLEVAVSGSGKVKLTGKADKTEIGISGSADVTAPDMAVQDMEIAISGTGNAHVNVEKSLQVAISGNGTVRYKGTPSKVEQSVSGHGKLVQDNNK